MVVPERINLAQDLLNKENVPWIELDNGYKIYTKLVSYKNVEQRWKLVYSQQAFDKEVETLNKNIAKEHKELTNLLKYNEYSRQKDAIKEVNNINKNCSCSAVVNQLMYMWLFYSENIIFYSNNLNNAINTAL